MLHRTANLSSLWKKIDRGSADVLFLLVQTILRLRLRLRYDKPTEFGLRH